jgi:hypothetical protein
MVFTLIEPDLRRPRRIFHTKLKETSFPPVLAVGGQKNPTPRGKANDEQF